MDCKEKVKARQNSGKGADCKEKVKQKKSAGKEENCKICVKRQRSFGKEDFYENEVKRQQNSGKTECCKAAGEAMVIGNRERRRAVAAGGIGWKAAANQHPTGSIRREAARSARRENDNRRRK